LLQDDESDMVSIECHHISELYISCVVDLMPNLTDKVVAFSGAYLHPKHFSGMCKSDEISHLQFIQYLNRRKQFFVWVFFPHFRKVDQWWVSGHRHDVYITYKKMSLNDII